MLCDICGLTEALVSTKTGKIHAVETLLCEDCLRAALLAATARRPATARVSSRLIATLIQSRGTRSAIVPHKMREMSDSTQCGGCGLTFAEFKRHGRAGCGQCYMVFEPAIEHALFVLHRPEKLNR